MNLAIIGYGKMGRLIEQLAPEYGFAVTQRLNSENNRDTAESQVTISPAWTSPWIFPPQSPHRTTLRAWPLCKSTPLSVPPAGRSSCRKFKRGGATAALARAGVPTIPLNLPGEPPRRIARYKEYGAWAWEIHHAAKKDAPSGTLLKVVDEMQRTDPSREVSVSSNRAGAHPGTHEIGFDSAADSLTIRHTARSREGFARGALLAARWVVGKQGWFEFRDVLFEQTASQEALPRKAGASAMP